MITRDTPVGTQVVLTESMHVTTTDGYNHHWSIEDDATHTIRRVGTNKAVVRRETDSGSWSAWVELYLLDVADPNAPRPRQLGEVPEGGISPDDPGLAWLWQDAAKVARIQGYCGQYDEVCERLGIPGRERTFTVRRTINGISASFQVQAHSQIQAERKVDDAMTSSQPVPA